MTLCYALSSGNWNDPGIWFNGVIPGPGDDVYTNGKNVTINVPSVTVKTLRRAAGVSPVTAAGGTFNISVACSLTVTDGILDEHQAPGVTGAVVTVLAGSHAVTINAPIISSGVYASAFVYGVDVLTGYFGALTFNCTTITCVQHGVGVRIRNAGVVVVNSDIQGYSHPSSSDGGGAFLVNGAITSFLITGNIRSGDPAGNTGLTFTASFTCPVTIVGNLRGGDYTSGASITCNGTITVTASEIRGGIRGTGLTVGGTGEATVRATTLVSGGGAIISNGSNTRILRVSGVATLVPPTPLTSRFPINGPFNFIEGEPFQFQLAETTSAVRTFRSGGAGSTVAVPGGASEAVVRSAGALFGLTLVDADTALLAMPGEFEQISDPDLFAAQLTYGFGSGDDELGWLTVTARGVQMFADTADVGGDPNHVPIAGSVLFLPVLSKPVRRLSTNEILGISSALAVFDGNGELAFDGEEDIRLIAPLWSDLSNTAWKWSATFQPAPGQSWISFTVSFTGAPGAVINLGSLV